MGRLPARAHHPHAATGSRSAPPPSRPGRNSADCASPHPAPAEQIAPATLRIDPTAGIHLARTLADLGRSLETEISPLGEEGDGQAVLAMDATGRVFSIDHTGDWYLGPDIDQALATLITGMEPARLTSA